MAAGLRKIAVEAPAEAPSAWVLALAPGVPRGAAAGVRWLRLPSAEHGLRYRWWRWRGLLPALWRPHRLRPEGCGHYASRCRPGAALGARFAALFHLREDSGAGSYPFVYTQGVVDLLQARVLADLGANGRRVRLLRHRLQFVTPEPAVLAHAVQDLDCRLLRVVQVGPTEVAALLQTNIADEAGCLLAQIEDVFVVRALDVAFTVQASTDDLLRRALSRMRRRAREIDPSAQGVRRRQLFVAPAAGRHFAAIGGGPLQLARAPVAPMLLRHLVAREFAEWGLDQSRLEMTFLAAVAPGRMLQLLLQGRSFELVDGHGRLAACGRI